MEIISKLSSVTYILLIIIFLIPFMLRALKKFLSISWSEIQTIVISLGVLGTFIGIVIGLLNFDSNNIQKSIPLLLSGLKTSFFTSIFSMSYGLLIKLYASKKANDSDTIKEENYVIKMITILSDISDNQKEQTSIFNSQLQKIENALNGDGETTLITQIQKLRTSFTDKFQELSDDFKNFEQRMAENNYHALVIALKDVINDFNAKINEQFGDNFKQLNQAVGKMLTWQEEYKNHIVQTSKQLNDYLYGINKINVSMQKINNETAIFKDTAISLDKLLNKFDTEIKQIEQGINSFAKLSDKAEQSLPMINKNITRLTTGFTDSINENLKTVNKVIINQENSVDQQIRTLKELYSQMGKEMITTNSKMNQHFEDLTNKNNERLINQLSELDKALENELNKSISSLGGQLTSLSRQFVDDYLPLTKKLKEVLTISKGLN